MLVAQADPQAEVWETSSWEPARAYFGRSNPASCRGREGEAQFAVLGLIGDGLLAVFEHLDVSVPSHVVDAVAHIVSQQAVQAFDPHRLGRLADEVEELHGPERLVGLGGVGYGVELRGRNGNGAATKAGALVVRGRAVELPRSRHLPLQRSGRVQVIEQDFVAALRALPLHLDEAAAAFGLAGVRTAAGMEDLDLRARVAARAAQFEPLASVVKLTCRLNGDAGRDVGMAAEDGPTYRDAVARAVHRGTWEAGCLGRPEAAEHARDAGDGASRRLAENFVVGVVRPSGC